MYSNQTGLAILTLFLGMIFLTGCGGGGENDSAGEQTKPTISTAGHDIFVPESVATDALSGDVDGAMLYIGSDAVGGNINKPTARIAGRAVLSNRDAAGFVAQRPAFNGETNASEVMETVKNSIRLRYSSFTSTGTQTNPAQLRVFSRFALNTFSTKQPTELATEILNDIGINKTDGIITNLPTALATEPFASEYTVFIGITYFGENDIVLLVSVVPDELSNTYSSLSSTLTNGTIVSPSVGAEIQTDTDSFIMPAGSGKADFLFVIDNSGSMSDEQQAISSAATAFVNAITLSGLDYQVGTITTDRAILRDTNGDGGFTNDVAEYQDDVKPGISGSGTEAGIWFAEQALLSQALGDADDGTLTIEGYPRTDASMNIVIMSDEPSQYERRSRNILFDVSNNLFITRNYTVHAIIDPTQNNYSQYDDLASATGGSTADISDTTTFEAIMNNIAKEAGGASSTFVLNNIPIASTITVSLNGVTIVHSAIDGWEYNVANNTILFNGSALPTEGDAIVVKYEYFIENS